MSTVPGTDAIAPAQAVGSIVPAQVPVTQFLIQMRLSDVGDQ